MHAGNSPTLNISAILLNYIVLLFLSIFISYKILFLIVHLSYKFHPNDFCKPSGRAHRPFYIIASGSEPPNAKSRPTLTVQLQPIVCPIKIIPHCHSSDTWDDVICPSRPHVLALPVPSVSDIGSALAPSNLSYCGNRKHKHNWYQNSN